MCGIFFFIGEFSNNPDSLNTIRPHFLKTTGRGPDDNQLIQIGNKIFGFHRLSIVDLSPKGNQPFNIDGIYLICNGEIYNHDKLKKKNNFKTQSNSDCEVIIHMYKKYGIETTIKNLDGVFAFILYDSIKEEVYIARDAFGVRPLFYGKKKNNLILSSELKSISDLCDYSQQFKPGSYTLLDNNNYSEFQYNEWYKYDYNLPIEEENILHGIRNKLTQSVQKRLMSDRPIGCLLSGGLDSSLICSIVAREFKKQNKGILNTFSIGLKGSTDLYYAKRVANHIGSKHHQIELSEQDFLEAIPEVIYAIESYDTTTVRASTANYLIGKYIKENTNITVIYNGDGSDEQSGYIYLKNAPSKEDFNDECIRLLKEIHLYDCLRSDRSISSKWSLEARTPFLDKEFVEFYMSIDPSLKMYSNKIEKYLLRKAFEKDNFLPQDVLWRRKEAFSDGCSSNERSWHNIIKEHVDKIITEDEYKKYLYKFSETHNPPKTKEQVYYRIIFDQYFKNKELVIPHFWMPKWCGNQSDPSARELSIYTTIN